MGLRAQQIEISYTINSIVRNVYCVQDNEQLKFQIGFVNYINEEVPVWRSMDPKDNSLDVPWKNGKWRNIYVLDMAQAKKSYYKAYELKDVEFEGNVIPLPKVSPELTHSFKSHLNKYNT